MKTIKWLIVIGLLIASLSTCSLFCASVTIENMSSLILVDVYISSSDSPTWGSDYLRSSIFPGDSETYNGIAPGDYDLKVVESGGLFQTYFGATLIAGDTWVWTVTD